MSDLTEQFVSDLTRGQPRLFAYIMSLLRNPDEARDVLQNTNLVLWRKLDEYADIASFEAWSTRIAYYQVLAFRRDRGRDRHQFSEALLSQIATAAEAETKGIDQRMVHLHGCIQELSDDHRELLVARYTKQTPVRQIAETAGKSPAALAMALYRIRQLLLQCIEGRLQGEGSQS
jgi:RNA polymerase sigma-70 factor (ECF subfamily)